MSRLDEESPLSVYLRRTIDFDFVVGDDKFNNLRINPAPEIKGFHYFLNPRKTFVKRFILKRTQLSEKVCCVTLIKNENGKFEPRFEFQIIDLTKKAIETITYPVSEPEERLLKARVSLDDCHETYSQLLTFLNDCSDIELADGHYAVVTTDQKELLEKAIKDSEKQEVMEAIAEKFGHDITEADVNIITKRKSALARFKQLLNDPSYFAKYQQGLKEHNKSHRREDVWQHFFERNTWIFGYGLKLVACEPLDDRKLETIVVGADFFDGAGKRIDGLLKTKGALNSSLFTEIKLHDAALLEKYDRPAVWSPGKELRGAIAQMQKTLHKVNLKVTKNFQVATDKEGSPTGEIIAFVRPRGLVLAGTLSQFETDHGINEEMFASFELYRQQITGIEILTYDELYERARFIVEDK